MCFSFIEDKKANNFFYMKKPADYFIRGKNCQKKQFFENFISVHKWKICKKILF